uniref:RNA helicase n=1 Tax=Ephydatia muelleri TaxID=6052 RepID=A0A0B5E850_EPHMU|nr:vasa protein [Ephydatia muelleri]
MAAGINFDKYDDIPVDVTGADPPPHITTFEDVEFFESTKATVAKCGYKRPTPVQKYAVPIILAGRDLMACAQTGSGKTAAFLLPAITKLIKEEAPGGKPGRDPVPTRCLIISSNEGAYPADRLRRARSHSRYGVSSVVAYGGTAVGYQLRQLEGGCNILVGTPGRLLDFLNRGKVQLDKISILILDEADRMLDMGFEPEIRKIVSNYGLPETGKRQTLMFSATFPEEIQRIANEFLHNYLFLTVGRVGGATSDITQRIIEVDEFGKREKLSEILSATGVDRTLVFVETKRNADFLATYLSQESFPTTSIHGDRFQREREEALRDFRSGRAPVLVATSVAARGLDIPDVKHVVNYDLPNNIEEYVHRIGRTGRIGNQGLATAFFHKEKDAPLARALIKVLADALQDVPDFLEAAAEAAVGTNYGPAGGRFASKDYRQGGGRGHKGDSNGVGNDQGGFGNFSESTTGGFSSSAGADDEKWD